MNNWLTNIRHWQALPEEQKQHIRWEGIPEDVARSMAFEGEPVPVEKLRETLARIAPPVISTPHSAS